MVLAFGGALFVLPFYMELGLGFPTMVASLFLTIASIAAAVSAPIGGGLYDRLGPRIACLIASGSSLLAFLIFFSLGVGEPQRMILVLALALMGISYGMYAPPTLSIVLGLCPQNQGQASSIMMTFHASSVKTGMHRIGPLKFFMPNSAIKARAHRGLISIDFEFWHNYKV